MRRSMLLFLVVGAFVLVACGREGAPIEAEPVPAGDADASGAILSTGSCVDRYSIEGLRARDYAFDGTVKAIEPSTADRPDRVVFDVQTWFKGDSGAVTTRQSFGVGAVTSTATEAAPLEVGKRLLVAGDDDFIWECGYTQSYDARVAAEWESALRS